MLKKIAGKHSEIAKDSLGDLELEGNEKFLDSITMETTHKENLATILVDLPRSDFYSTNGKTEDNFIQDWINMSSNTYMQGNMTASFYEMLVTQFILQSKHFVNAEAGRTEENRFDYWNFNKISFAYYDDDDVLCGVSICGNKNDPNLWAASIIRNTTASPECRDVQIITSAEILRTVGEDLSNIGAAEAFLDFLNSKKISGLLTGVLTDEGTLDNEKIRQLQKDFEERSGYNPTLAKAAQQSFARRNAPSLTVGVIAFVALISIVLTFTGFLAPLGFSLAAALLTCAALAVIIMGAQIKLAFNELSLSNYTTQVDKANRKQVTFQHLAKELEQTDSKIIKMEGNLETLPDPTKPNLVSHSQRHDAKPSLNSSFTLFGHTREVTDSVKAEIDSECVASQELR